MRSIASVLDQVTEQELYRGKRFSVVTRSVELPTGEWVEAEVLRHPGAAAVLPLESDSHLLLLRQYRPAVGGWIWELPAGTLRAGEEPATCAQRELREEAGYAAGRMDKLGEMYAVPDFSDDLIHVFLATDLHVCGQALEADEAIEVVPVTVFDTLRMVRAGEIRDAKTIASILLYFTECYE